MTTVACLRTHRWSLALLPSRRLQATATTIGGGVRDYVRRQAELLIANHTGRTEREPLGAHFHGSLLIGCNPNTSRYAGTLAVRARMKLLAA